MTWLIDHAIAIAAVVALFDLSRGVWGVADALRKIADED